ncbi:MAG: tetratricopeptide repeat protein [Methanobacteriota archaeon]
MSIDDSFHKGLKAYRDGRYEEAVSLLYSAVSDNEENHKAWNALGVTFSKMGRIEEAINCYENALKYDPGNMSYEQNRDQIVQKAFSRLPQVPDLERPAPVVINYQRFIVPSILLILVGLIAIYVLFISSFLGGGDISTQQPTPLPTPEIIPFVTPEVAPSSSNNSLNSSDQNATASNDLVATPDILPSQPESSIIITGDLIGKYYNGLSEVTFPIGIADGGIPQYLPRVNYLWSVGTMDPIQVLPANPASGTMKPGKTQLVTIQIPLNQQPRAGENFSIEIRPASGAPTSFVASLPSDYNGGIIKNPAYQKTGSSSQSVSVLPSNSTDANLILDGSLSGYYSNELEQLTFTIRTAATGTPQDLTRITYLWNIGTNAPVQISKINPSSGTINPGERQLITLTIPEDNRPLAGESFTLEIKPDIGQSIIEKKTLSSGYKGGTIS